MIAIGILITITTTVFFIYIFFASFHRKIYIPYSVIYEGKKKEEKKKKNRSRYSIRNIVSNDLLKFQVKTRKNRVGKPVPPCIFRFGQSSSCYGFSVHVKDIGRRLPLKLQCSYQGQKGDVGQSVRGNYKTHFFLEGQNLTAVEGNECISYQVNLVSRINAGSRHIGG